MISVILRTRGHPGLRRALAGLAAQDHPRLEILVVDTQPPPRAALPPLPLRPGHTLRRLATATPLTPAQAANAGLDAATGDWLAWLDDDSFYDPAHLAHLLRQATPHPHALAVYCRTKLVDADGRVLRRWGAPYHRALFWYGPVLHLAAALIRRAAVVRGVRFDERLAVGADRDLIAQIAALGGAHGSEPVFVDGDGVNAPAAIATPDTATALDSDALLRAKWAGTGLYHTERAALLTRQGLAALARGDLATARERLEHTLAEYPQDPSALNALARVAADQGDLHAAARLIDLACDLHGGDAELRLHAALIHARLGAAAQARRHAQAAACDPALAETAASLLAALPAEAGGAAAAAAGPDDPLIAPDAPITPRAALDPLIAAARPASPLVADALADAPAAAARAHDETPDVGGSHVDTAATPDRADPAYPADTPRTAPCPCGSGRRFRDCHGRLDSSGAGLPAPPAPAPAPATLAQRLDQAQQCHARGEAAAALRLLAPIAPEAVGSAAAALTIAAWLDACGMTERAFAFAARAAQLDRDAAIAPLAYLAARRHQAEWDAGVARAALSLAQRLDRRDGPANAARAAAPVVHIVVPLDRRSAAVRHALELADTLSARTPVRVWTPVPPLPEHRRRVAVRPLLPERGEHPVDGLLVLIGHDIDYGGWLRNARPRRVVLRVDEPPSNRLLGRLVDLEASGAAFRLDLAFASAALRDACGAAAAACHVETTPLQLDALCRDRPPPRGSAAGTLTLGRIVDDARRDLHPNDPALWRQLLHQGHAIRVLGGGRPLAAAFRNERWPQLGLLPARSLGHAEFLTGLDVLLHRSAPGDRQPTGIALLEAMAMHLPVIAFARADTAEWLDDGVQGLIVNSEAAALEAVAQLARDAALRARLAQAARAHAEARVEAARREALRFYLDLEVPAVAAD